ncbi:MAG: FAD-dependent oxidoreductase, partial [Rhodobacteraceae bacterium]|nr:FAD-dependent oxidoreductase [Paracoccaceae bacterium]
MEAVPFETNETLFDLRDRPDHLLIIGGGPIGMEMAQAHRRLGCKVTVIEGAKALGKDDPELAAVVLDHLRAEGVVIAEEAKVVEVSGKKGALEVVAEDGRRFKGTHLLVAVGRKANMERLNLDIAGGELFVALRGDPPKGETQFQAVDGGLRYANELVALIRAEFPALGIAVAGYPEVHQEAANADDDLANLVRKVDCGADAVVTQLFYDNEDFFRFRDKCVAAGIKVPVVPGLLPVLSLGQVQRIASLCKARLPAEFVARLQEKEDPQWQFQVGVEHA